MCPPSWVCRQPGGKGPSCLERAVGPLWPAWFLQEPNPCWVWEDKQDRGTEDHQGYLLSN